MSYIALELDGVWKKFRRGERHDSLRDLIPSLFRKTLSLVQSELRQEEFWALRDISFSVRRGEALGIIGSNGSGKSTTLKLLSGILRPTRGKIEVSGRLSALIEVGAGFHQDLTGRENIYLNGAILGMRREEIDKKLEEIIEFSGISDFIDTPVKRYSSGMYARLGFSIAAHVDPEILLVDEVLSVGDMSFQEKSINKMMAFKDSDASIIFVSHNLASVNLLCARALLIDKGEMKQLGPTGDVIREYIRLNSSTNKDPQDGNAIFGIRLQDESGNDLDIVQPEKKLRLLFNFRCDRPLNECRIGFSIQRSPDGLSVCDYSLPLTAHENATKREARGIIYFDANLLRGAYSISLRIFHYPSAGRLVSVDNGVFFSVEERMSRKGVAHLNPRLILDGY